MEVERLIRVLDHYLRLSNDGRQKLIENLFSCWLDWLRTLPLELRKPLTGATMVDLANHQLNKLFTEVPAVYDFPQQLLSVQFFYEQLRESVAEGCSHERKLGNCWARMVHDGSLKQYQLRSPEDDMILFQWRTVARSALASHADSREDGMSDRLVYFSIRSRDRQQLSYSYITPVGLGGAPLHLSQPVWNGNEWLAQVVELRPVQPMHRLTFYRFWVDEQPQSGGDWLLCSA